jgi:hypothetical protein
VDFTLAVKRTCKKQGKYTVKNKPGGTRQNSDGAGATPPFDAPCVTVARRVAPAPPVRCL